MKVDIVRKRIFNENNSQVVRVNTSPGFGTPTAALIFGSYLGAHTEALVEASMHWYKQQVTAPPPDLAPEPPQIYVPPEKEIKL